MRPPAARTSDSAEEKTHSRTARGAADAGRRLRLFCILSSLATVPGPQRHPGGLTIGQAASRGHGSAQQLIPSRRQPP